MTTKSNLHAHVSTYAVDCDGPISRDYVRTMTPEEQNSDHGDMDFRDRVLCSIVSTYTCWDGTLRVQSDEMNGLTKTLDWTETTEEGGRTAHAQFCEDDCDTEESGYRDHRAESMGY